MSTFTYTSPFNYFMVPCIIVTFNGGIRTPTHATIFSNSNIKEFVGEHSYPVVRLKLAITCSHSGTSLSSIHRKSQLYMFLCKDN